MGEDMKRALKKCVQEDKATEIVHSLLGQEINNVRKEGLIDCRSEKEFDLKFDQMKKKLPESFVKWMDSKKNRLRTVGDTMKKCMLWDVRVSAGLGCPPNKFTTNRCEALNHVLKEAIDHSKSDIVRFLEIAKEKVRHF